MSISATAAGSDTFGRFTENGNTIGAFTLGGTLGLVVFVGLLGGVAGSVVVIASDPWLRWAGPLRGIGFGIGVLTIFGYETFASVDFRVLDPVALNVAMFFGLFVGFGAVVGLADWWLHRKLPEAADHEQVGYMLAVAVGALPLFLALLFFTSATFCGCEPAHEIGLALLVMIISTIIHHLSTATDLIAKGVTRASAITGHASLAAAVIFGGVRIIDDLQLLL
jgi:hypothetical protein